MESKFRVLGHGAHPILIVFPLGLLSASVIFDLIYLIRGNPQWTTLSFWLIAAGVIGGLAAAVPGLVDWIYIPSDTRAKSVGLIHGVGNVIVVCLFGASWFLRRHAGAPSVFDQAAPPGTGALFLSFAGFLLALFTGWLGGELVERLGIAVHPGANPDAPNSLSGRPATETSNRS